MKLWNKLKESMMQHPKQYVCEKQAQITYEELVIFAEAFGQKITGEKCCAILCGNEMAAAMALLSCFAAGVTAVPLSTRYGQSHCASILDMIRPTAMITDMDGELQLLHFSDSDYTKPNEHPALIMCTSGTTGTPKGAMLSESNILTNISDIAAYLKISETDSILIARPLYHCAVLTGEFLTSLLKGTRIRFCSEHFDPKALLDLIEATQITVFCGTPTLLSLMARFRRKEGIYTLKTICISGECLDPETGVRIANAFPRTSIYHVYGLTEACPRVSYLPPELFSEHPDCVGLPLRSVSIKIIKDDGTIAHLGEEGTLWVKGNNVMLGYYNAPELTKKVLKGNWLCTGDIAVVNNKGLLQIKGRIDDLIIRAGMNIYPQEVECALKSDHRVRDVLVYGIPSQRLGMQIGMKISGDFTSIDEIRKLCNALLPAYQTPSKIELLDDIPRNGSGKKLRQRNK